MWFFLLASGIIATIGMVLSFSHKPEQNNEKIRKQSEITITDERGNIRTICLVEEVSLHYLIIQFLAISSGQFFTTEDDYMKLLIEIEYRQ